MESNSVVTIIPPRQRWFVWIGIAILCFFSSALANENQSALGFITETVKSSYECLTYDCNQRSPPEILKLLQVRCEAEKEALGCATITNKNPEDAKYIRSCEFKKICERKLIPPAGLNIVACLKGAAQVYEDYANYFLKVSYLIEEHHDELKACTSIACKRSMSAEVPEFDRMTDETLLKYPAAYIEGKVGSYQAYVGQYERTRAAQKYFNENTAQKRFQENQSRRLKESSLELDYIELGKKKLRDAKIILDCYDDQAYTEILCHAVLKVIAPGVAIKGAASGIRSLAALTVHKIERRGAEVIQKHLFESERSLFRQLFSEKHFFRKFTTKEQNAFYINAAEESIPKPGRLFFRIENGVLKHLNSEIGDKVLVTSINNKYNEILFRKLEELKKKFPDIEFPPYQGFKEVEFMAVTKSGKPVPSNLVSEVDRLFQEANQELKNHLEVNSILRSTDQPQNWYSAGVGRTGDMANAAARESREGVGRNVLVSYDDPVVLAKLERSVTEGRKLSDQLATEFAGTEMVSVRDGVSTLNSDVMGIVRKTSDAAELRQALSTKYPAQNITLEQSEQIQQLYEIQDRFSPPVRFAEREIASFTSSRGTEVGIDFVNAGGANAEGQLRALVGSRSGSDMLSNSRTQFRKATEELDRKKAQFIAIGNDLAKAHNQQLKPGAKPMTVTVAKSGDDSVATFSETLTQEQKDWIAKEWARREAADGRSASSARISIPNEIVESVIQKNILAGHGEGIEKSLRSKLTGNLPNKDLDQILIKIEMKGHKSGTGYVNLSIATGNGKSLTSDQILAIKKNFEKAVKEINTDSGGKKSLRYGAGEMRILGN